MIRTEDQTLNLQLDALQQAGCNEIFQDTASGSTIERKGLEEALAFSRPGATLEVWRDLQPHLARCVVPTAQMPALRSAAAASLARLWQGQGKHGEAHWMLEEIRRWFPEGIGTPDLTEARSWPLNPDFRCARRKVWPTHAWLTLPSISSPQSQKP